MIITLANPSEKSHRPRSRLIPVDFIGIFGNLATTTADTTGVTKREGRKVTVMPPRVFPVNWFYRLTGSHLRVVVLCEMVVLTTRTVRVISCLILLLIHKIK